MRADRRLISKYLLVIAASVFGLAACGGDEITLSDGWVRAAPPGAGMMAGYLTIENGLGHDVELVAVNSPDFGAVELHETIVTDGVASMRRVTDLVVATGDVWRFEPGGRHLMLMRPTGPLAVGDQVTVTLMFSGQPPLTVELPVLRAAPGSRQ